jgi:hypothetical protein
MMLHDASAAKPTLTYNDASIDKEIKVTYAGTAKPTLFPSLSFQRLLYKNLTDDSIYLWDLDLSFNQFFLDILF